MSGIAAKIRSFVGEWSEERLQAFISTAVDVILTALALSVLYFLASKALNRILSPIIGRALAVGDPRREAMAKTVIGALHSTFKYAFLIAATLILLEQMGVPIKSLLAAVGVVGLAVGLGAQTLVRDVVAGFFVLIEGQYAVGDDVTISGSRGVVERVGLRVTRIKDTDGNLVLIPNGRVGVVINHSNSKVEEGSESP